MHFYTRISLLLAGSVCLFSQTANAQNLIGSISTAGHGLTGPTNTARPFGLAFAPNGDLYVSLAGSSVFANPQLFNNNAVVRIDTTTNTIVADITCDLFPEDIAFAQAPGGFTFGIVANSTAGNATVFDVPTNTPIATISLGGFFTAFPTGVTVNAAGDRAYVSVNDGSQSCVAIDLDIASPTFLQTVPSDTVVLTSGTGARITRFGNDLIAPTTAYLPGFAGSTGAVERFALPGSANTTVSTVLRSEGTFSMFPSSQDVAVSASGIAYVCGYDLGNRILAYDLSTGALLRAFPSGTAIGANTGVALSPDGKLLAVCDVASNEVAFIDVARGTRVGLASTASLGFGYFEPNDAVFAPNGQSLYVTVQGSEAVIQLSVPTAPTPFTPPLAFTVQPTTPASSGAMVQFQTVGASATEAVYVVADSFDSAVDLGAAGVLHFTGSASLVATTSAGDVNITIPAPTGPLFFGKAFMCQAVALDLFTFALRFSDEIPVVLQ